MALDPGKLRPGMKVVIENNLWLVTSFELRTPGNLRSFVRCKMKSLKDGRVEEMTFRGGAADVELADFETKSCQFLFKDADGYHFMDLTSYEQFTLSEEFLGFQSQFMVAESEIIVSFWEGRPVGINLPPKLVFKVTDTMDVVAKGNTSNAVMKDATIETGAVIKVPAFVKIGDSVRINTEDGTYVDRA